MMTFHGLAGRMVSLLVLALALASAAAGNVPEEARVARAAVPAPTRANSVLTPTSQLDLETARRIAGVAAILSGKDVVAASVLPTGSMQPYFDEHAILLLEAAPFDQLRLGDVVTFYHPRLKLVVAHRLVEKRGQAFWSKGDHNSGMDDVYVTTENYQRRLMGVIYADPRAKGAVGKMPAVAASK